MKQPIETATSSCVENDAKSETEVTSKATLSEICKNVFENEEEEGKKEEQKKVKEEKEEKVEEELKDERKTENERDDKEDTDLKIIDKPNVGNRPFLSIVVFVVCINRKPLSKELHYTPRTNTTDRRSS